MVIVLLNILSIFINLVFLGVLIIIVGTLAIDLKNFITGTGPFVPTNNKTIRDIFFIYDFKDTDYVADLGSGDGRILLEFAKRGIKSHGYEINPFLCFVSAVLIKLNGFSRICSVERRDFLKADYSEFNVFVVYGIKKLMPRLIEKVQTERGKNAGEPAQAANKHKNDTNNRDEHTIVISNKFQLPGLDYQKKLGDLYLYEL